MARAASAAGAAREPARESVRGSDGSQGLFSGHKRIVVPRLVLIACVIVLCVLGGLVMVYSASSVTAYNEFGDAFHYVKRQAVYLALGIIACLVCMAIPHRFWGHPAVAGALWAVGVGLLVMLVVLPRVSDLDGSVPFAYAIEANEAVRSFCIGGITLQPTEFSKVAILLAIASLFCCRENYAIPFAPFVVLLGVAVIVPVALIYQQPDLGTIVILCVGVLAVMLFSGASWRLIGASIGVVAALVVVICIVQPYHLTRVLTFLDSLADALPFLQSLLEYVPDEYMSEVTSDAKLQTEQARYAFSSGGLLGVGWGLSRQKYLYLPEAHTDFIFAIIGEECGLVGTLATVALYVGFVYAGLRISRNAPDTLGCVLSGSLVTMIGFQAFVNMAGTTGVLPLTGKALPFVSYGGSSLVASLIMVGIVLSVSLRSKVGVQAERRRDDLRVLDGGSRQRGGAEAPAKRTRTAAGQPGRLSASSQRASSERTAHGAGDGARTTGTRQRSRTGTRSDERSARQTGTRQPHAASSQRAGADAQPTARAGTRTHADAGAQTHTGTRQRTAGADAAMTGRLDYASAMRPARRSARTVEPEEREHDEDAETDDGASAAPGRTRRRRT